MASESETKYVHLEEGGRTNRVEVKKLKDVAQQPKETPKPNQQEANGQQKK